MIVNFYHKAKHIASVEMQEVPDRTDIVVIDNASYEVDDICHARQWKIETSRAGTARLESVTILLQDS